MQAWNDHSQSNKERAEMEMARAQKLRELIFHLIEQTTNDLRVQGGARFNQIGLGNINRASNVLLITKMRSRTVAKIVSFGPG